MTETGIPESVRVQVDEIVRRFNEEVVRDPDYSFGTRYEGSYLYLSRISYGVSLPICRLTYTGKMDSWEFAIYSYRRDTYDPKERFFFGSELVDGTVEGALHAGRQAYP